MRLTSLKSTIIILTGVAAGLAGCSSKVKSKRSGQPGPPAEEADSGLDNDESDGNTPPPSTPLPGPTPSGPSTPGTSGFEVTFSALGSAYVHTNGNLIVSDGKNSKFAANNGAIFVYQSKTGLLLAETYGDQADDHLALNGSIHELSNGNFALRSPADNNGAHLAAGSVILFNGKTGKEISRIKGDQPGDGLGKNGIGELANGNYYIISTDDNCSGAVKCGSVILANPTTGVEIGRTAGAKNDDQIAWNGIKNLNNGNYIIRSSRIDTDTLTNAGALQFVSGSTGTEIMRVEGAVASDGFAGRATLVLPNGNVVVSGGSTVMLLNGTTGATIGTLAEGPSNHLNSTGIKVLANGNYVIHNHDTTGGITGSGFTILVNGTTGLEISRISGDNANDEFGYYDVTELPNGNYVMRNPKDDNNSLTDNGSVILVNGTTGVEISRINGDQSGNNLGSNWVYALENGNYVIASSQDDTATLSQNGSVILMNGTTGVEISRIEGDQNDDQLGVYRIFEVSGGRYVIRSPYDNTAVVSKAGSVIFADSTTGAEVARFTGDLADAQLSLRAYTHYIAPGITDSTEVLQLKGGNFVITNSKHSSPGHTESGIAFLLKGSDLTEIASIEGQQSADRLGWRTVSIDDKRFAIISPYNDGAGFTDNGLIMIVDATTGAILKTHTGKGSQSLLGIKYFKVDAVNGFIFASDTLPGSESIQAIALDP